MLAMAFHAQSYVHYRVKKLINKVILSLIVMDGYRNNFRLNLIATDQLAFKRLIANEAHARNVSVGLKNDFDQVWERNKWGIRYAFPHRSVGTLLSLLILTGQQSGTQKTE